MREFINKNKDDILAIIIASVMIFLLFYWTHLFFESKRKNIISKTQLKHNLVLKVNDLYSKFQMDKDGKNKMISGGLLSFVQKVGNDLGMEEKIASLKPKTAQGDRSAVSVRFEQLNLNDIINILSRIDAYSDLEIDSLSLNRRFDDKNLADLYMEISKMI